MKLFKRKLEQTSIPLTRSHSISLNPSSDIISATRPSKMSEDNSNVPRKSNLIGQLYGELLFLVFFRAVPPIRFARANASRRWNLSQSIAHGFG